MLTTRGAPSRLYTPVSRRLIADVRTEQYLSEIADAFFLSMHQVHLQLAGRCSTTGRPPSGRVAVPRDAGVALVLTDADSASDVDVANDHGFGELPRFAAPYRGGCK